MFSFVFKLVLFLGLPLLVVWGIFWAIPRALSVDDLQQCNASPQALDSNCAAADAIVTISGGDTPARVREAIKLYKTGWAPKLIFSGAALDKTSLSNAAVMKQQALKAGVPAAVIYVDEQALNTAGNAEGVRAILTQQSVKRIILITSPYHQRRASIEFKRTLGPQVQIFNHPTSDDQLWPNAYWWATPDGWWLAVSELVKLLYVQVTVR